MILVRLKLRRIVVRERMGDGREVRMRPVDNPVVVKWYMTDDERLEESRRLDGAEPVGMADLGLTQPDRRGFLGGKGGGVGVRLYRWLKG